MRQLRMFSAGLWALAVNAVAGGTAVAATTDTPASPAPMLLNATYAFSAYVQVAAPIVVGQGPEGLRRFVPIIGGTVSGPLFSGKVISGAGDWQVVRSDGVIALEARYTLESSAGVKIAITNRGIRVASPAVTARMMRGDKVAPKEYYFRTVATVEAPVNSSYAWMNQVLFIGVAERTSTAAIVHFYRLD